MHLHQLAQMPLADYQSWKLYAEIEPFGSHYDDLRAGQITAATYNVNRDAKTRREPFGPLDFAPWNDVQKKINEPLTPAEEAVRQGNLMRAWLKFEG